MTITYEDLDSFFIKKGSADKIKKNKNTYSINNSDFYTVNKIAYYLFQTFALKVEESILLQYLEDKGVESNPSEKVIQIELAKQLGGEIEVSTKAGRIDILTETEIIEVKKASSWKHAIGQINAYSVYYPDKRKRIHLYGELPRNSYEDIYLNCKRDNIRFTYES